MRNKNIELETSILLVNDKLHFEGSVNGQKPISIDYVAPLGDDNGYTSLELLLLSLSSCLGSAVLVFLRRMQKTITGLEIKARGYRKDQHPTCFYKIILMLELKSSNTGLEEAEKVIGLAEATYCPVWAMLKGNTEIIVKPVIIS